MMAWLEVSEEKNVSMWPRDHFCDMLVKNAAVFCPCLKSLPDAKLKNFHLMLLAEELLKQPHVDYAMRLLVASLMQMYNEKRQAEQGII